MKTVKVDEKTCRFDAEKHKYYVNGQEVPGATTVTGVIDKSNALKWWAVNHARDYILENMEPGEEYDEKDINNLAQGARLAHQSDSSDAKVVGTVVHSFAEDWIQSKLNGKEEPDLPVNDEARESAQRFLDWVDSNDVEFLATEQIVFHPMFGYAGTYDCKAIVNGNRLIIDFKTSKRLYDEYDLQATGYLKAEQQRKPDENLDGYSIIRFPKSGADFEVKIETDYDQIIQHWGGFIAALRLYEWQQK